MTDLEVNQNNIDDIPYVDIFYQMHTIGINYIFLKIDNCTDKMIK